MKLLKRTSLLLLTAVVTVLCICLLTLPTQAHAATEGVFTYEIINGGATITACDASATGEIVIPDVLGGCPVNSIGYRAFYDCNGITSVIISDNVTIIDEYAFYDCDDLVSVTMGANVSRIYEYAFEFFRGDVYIKNPNQWSSIGCIGYYTDGTPCRYASAFHLLDENGNEITDLVLDRSVTKINRGAFNKCINLKSVTIPDTVTSIGVEAFRNCTALTSVTIPDTVTSIGKDAFSGCTELEFTQYENGHYLGNLQNPYVAFIELSSETATTVTLHNDTKVVPDAAFSGNKNLKSVTLGTGITTIGSEMFSSCTGLTSVSIPDSVTRIEEKAFYNCKALPAVKIPNSVTFIGRYAFQSCTSLASVEISESINMILDHTFSGCESLTSITIPSSVEFIYKGAFSSSGLKSITIPDGIRTISASTFSGCSKLTSVIIPDSVTTIGEYAFQNTGFTTFTFPDSVSSISDYVFSDCKNLTSFTIHDGVFSIGEYAFSRCPSLSHIEIPESVSSIGAWAFYQCTRLNSVVIYNSMRRIENCAFYMCDKLEEVYYWGTESQWNSLKAGVSVWDSSFTNAKVIYNRRPIVLMSDDSDLCIEVDDVITLYAQNDEKEGVTADYSGFIFQLTDSSVVKVEKAESRDDGFLLQLRGLQVGSTDVTINDTSSGRICTVNLTVKRDDPDTYTLSGITKSGVQGCPLNYFYNYNGLYIDEYWYQVKNDQSANVSFTVYNTNFCYGIVESYTEDGELYQAVLIDRMRLRTTNHYEFFFENTAVICYSLVYNNGTEAYKDAIRSQKTGVKIEIPKNGYLKITSDINESDLLGFMNIVDVALVAGQMCGEFAGLLSDYKVAQEVTNEVVKSPELKRIVKEGTGILADMMFDLSEETFFTPEIVTAFAKQVFDQFTEVESQKFKEIIKKSIINSGVELAADFALKFVDNIGPGLNILYKAGEFDNTYKLLLDLREQKYGGFMCISNQSGCTLSSHQVSLESDVAFEDEVVARVYTVEVDEALLEKVKSKDREYYDLLTDNVVRSYDISLMKNGQESQHSAKVTVGIPIPYDLQSAALSGNIKVYRIEEDGTLTDMNARVKDGNVTFETSHFSLYTIVGYNPEEITESIFTYSVYQGKATITGCNTDVSGAVTIPDALGEYPVTAIGSYAFDGCTGITSVIIHNQIVSIGDCAFRGCTGLTTLTVPGSVKAIGTSICGGCENLTKILVDSTNSAYTSDEYGVLFNKEKTTLFQAPGALAGNYDVPYGVLRIDSRAFAGCKQLKTVTLSESVTRIGSEAFAETAMTSVSIPASVVRIDSNVFANALLDEVFYDGTQITWNKIKIHEENELLNNVPIVFEGYNFDDSPEEDYEDDPEAKSGWVLVDGIWYYFENGEMVKDRWVLDSVGWCYLLSDGKMATQQWIMDSQGWCYVDASGYCVTNCWMQDSIGWCYLNAEGRMAVNSWILDSVGWCYVGADGYCVTNCWMQDSIGWCYLNAEGRMAVNSWILDSVGWCYVGADGYCVTNCWMQDSIGWVYLDAEGRMVTNSWIMDSVGWCYLGEDGYAVTNCWKRDSVGWCYLNSNGSMTKNQWVYDDGQWYYLDGNGYMLLNTARQIDGKTYYFGANGVCTNP